MTHMVTYRSGEGQPVYHPTESLEEAAHHVEQLRNAGQGGDARIFRMEEVPMEVKTYYKVELPGVVGAAKADAAPAAPLAAATAAADDGAEAAAPPAAVASPVEAAPAPTPAPMPASAPATVTAAATPPASKSEPAAAGANGNGGRFGLFGKG